MTVSLSKTQIYHSKEWKALYVNKITVKRAVMAVYNIANIHQISFSTILSLLILLNECMCDLTKTWEFYGE